MLTSFGSNMTVIAVENGDSVLVSYSTPVAALVGGVFFRTEKKFSMTTSKHINKWSGSFGIAKGEGTLKPQKWFNELVNISLEV